MSLAANIVALASIVAVLALGSACSYDSWKGVILILAALAAAVVLAIGL